TEQQHPRVEQLQLALDVDLGQQQVALVAIPLFRAQRTRHPPLAAFVLPLVEPAGHRHDVGVTKLRERLRRERGARTTRAVHDEWCGPVGNATLDVRLELPAGMCTAPGIAPCSYSSGSRTSSTTAPGRARRSSAVAVSISRICSFVARSKSRKLAIVDLSSGIPTGDPKTLPDRSTFRDSGAACEDAGAHANPAAHRALPRERRRGHHRRGGG